MMRAAIFDFDRTLFPEETFPLMMRHLKTHPVHYRKYRRFMSKLLPIYAAYKLKLYPEQKMKAQAMQFFLSSFASASREEIEEFFMQLGRQMKDGLSAQVMERLRQHRKEGCYIMVVSGAFEPLLHTVLQHADIDCVIGTPIPFTEAGLDITAAIDHVHGKRKTEKIYEQLQDKCIDWKCSYAYGDSYADLDVLELVGNPVAVQPESRLLQIAEDRSWEMMS